MSMMDFDLSKENIQPLRGGRNVTQLGVALEAQNNLEHQRELLQQREEFENLIKNYNGTDPLANWYNYISWVEQAYPKHGLEGNLVALLEQVLSKFEDNKQYTDDRRFCKLWIKYIDLQHNPVELYHMMYGKGLCRGCADLYRAWAYYHEAAGNFQAANHVFECGKAALAQPYEELESAHQQLVMAAGQHVLYGTNERVLVEKRQALTSLQTYKQGRVSNIRIPGESTPFGGGATATTSNRNTFGISAYEDKGDESKVPEAAPVSLITAAKRLDVPKENTLKPGPWTTVPAKKRFTVQNSIPNFNVHEDNDDTNCANIGNVNQIINFPKTSLENYSNWHVSLTLEDPKDDRMIPMYPKNQVYSDNNTEYSIEELKARIYFSKKHNQLLDNSIKISNNSNDILQNEQLNNSIGIQPILQQNQKLIDNSLAKTPHEEASEALLQLQQSIPLQTATTTRTITNNDWLNTEEEDVNVFNVWNSPDISNSAFKKNSSLTNNQTIAPKMNTSKFSIYEQSSIGLQEQVEPRVKRFCPNPGSAMKTPFKTLNADDLAETGSRGGMDIGAAAQPMDSAKRLPIYDDNSSDNLPLVNEVKDENAVTLFSDSMCNTEIFNFNLNAMQVSTPQNKQFLNCNNDGNNDMLLMKNTRKQLFNNLENNKQNDYEKTEKALSTIFEETKSYGSSSSSSGATTKSSLFTNHTTKISNNNNNNNIGAISEEHNNYLAQNLMANAALRSSLLGDLMDFNTDSNKSSRTASNNSIISSNISSNNSNTNNSLPNNKTIEIKPLEFVPSDPFKPSLINKLLQRVTFPGSYTKGYYVVNNIPKLIVRKESVTIGSDKYVIEKQLGKGTFGTVFRGLDLKTNNIIALKHQKPPNKWEFYICRELHKRLIDHPLKDRFMDVFVGYFNDQASILISEFVPWGSLLDVANIVKQKSGRSMKESLCIYFCLNMLKVVKTMHDVKIIHADIKPDNFLVQLMPDGTVGLQLIDFGCSIDMTLFPNNASFTRRITTEDFVCCEMRDGRPWNYHTDLFCIAATAHVLLFEKYIRLRKKDDHWSIEHRMPRYLNSYLWNTFFSSLLNQQNGLADSLALQNMLDESLKHRADDYLLEMRLLTNILKNR